MQKKSVKEMSNKQYICEFCNRKFHKEITLINHNCEKKRRWFNKDDSISRIAFMAWVRFHELNNNFGKVGNNKLNFKDFMNSEYYTSFIKFAKHLKDLNVLESNKFIDYVIKNNLPLNKWTHDVVYENYINNLLKSEQPESALARNIELMQKWSQQSGEQWHDFFRKISPIQAAAWVKDGRISPWVLYNADSAEALIDRCGQEQLNIIERYAKVPLWKIRFNQNKEIADWIRNTLRQAGL